MYMRFVKILYLSDRVAMGADGSVERPMLTPRRRQIQRPQFLGRVSGVGLLGAPNIDQKTADHHVEGTNDPPQPLRPGEGSLHW